jgi:ankyrin repeat protein
MGHAGDPLSYAVGGHLREAQSLPHRGTIGLARFLLEHGADPNKIQFPQFESPGYYLFVACQRADVEVVRLLLEHGAQIEGSGAAQVAAAKGRIDVLDVLLQHGADLNACFKSTGIRGKEYEGSATEVATRYEHDDVVLWLAEHGVQ